MELMHYSDVPVVLDRTRVYEPQSDGEYTYEKPQGFWVSVAGDDDWPAWCESEDFRLGRLIFSHRVTLAAGANVLILESPSALDAFTGEYRPRGMEHAHSGLGPGIDWRRVADRYDGIVIAPYQYSRRFDLAWYYGWDCASGCIWNLDAIADLVPADGVVA